MIPQYPQVCWFLLVAPPVLIAFFWWALHSRQKVLTKFIEARLLTSLTAGVSTTRRKIRFAMIIMAVEFLIFALARPYHSFDLQEVEQRGLDIVVAVDTSKSMLATDIAPNRLGRAKLAALELMQKSAVDRLGLVAFAGEAFLECPLTVDNAVFQQSVQQLDVNSIPQGGTAIAAAIRTAMDAFKEQDHHTALVLLTDGEDNDEGALDAAKEAAKAGMKIFTIGIGSAEGTLVQVKDANGNTDYIRDDQGQVLKSKLNESLLQQIATETGGFYLPLRGVNTIDTLYERGLSELPKTESHQQMSRRYHEQFQWPLAAAIVLLLSEMFFPERKRERKASTPPPVPRAAAVGALVLLAMLGLAGQSMASPGSAMRDYQAGHFTNALTEYDRLADVTTNDLRLVFNAGDAAYRATNYDEAVRCFTAVTLSPDLKLQQRAYYNLGNTKYRQSNSVKDLEELQHAWEEVVTIYEHAVDLDKQDADAAYNLAFLKKCVEELKEFRAIMERLKNEADSAVRQSQYHRALEIMQPLLKNQVGAKQFEDYIKKLKDIDAIVTPTPAPQQR